MPIRVLFTMPRWSAFLLLACLGGCAKPDLPDRPVRAASAGDLAAFRSELDAEFPAGRLQPFDTALQELKLAAMNDGVASAAARDAQMQAEVNGKTIREVLLLGWQARRARLGRETELMTSLLERDVKVRDQAPSGQVSPTIATRIQNEQDILARLRQNLADTDHQLAEWGAKTSVP